MIVEQKVNDYHQKRNKWMFSNYFKLTDALDSDQFCTLANNYPVGQAQSILSQLLYRLS